MIFNHLLNLFFIFRLLVNIFFFIMTNYIDKNIYRRLTFMNNEETSSIHDVAKKMIIDGETFDTIMEKTHLRLKDLKRIQRDEIDPKF